MSPPPPILRYLLYLSVVSIISTVPYAVPALWGNFLGNFVVPQFLHNPVESQRWYVIIGSAWLLVPVAFVYPQTKTLASCQRSVLLAVISWFCYSLLRALLLPHQERPLAFILLHSAFFVSFLTGIGSAISTSELNRLRVLLIAGAMPLCLMAISQKVGSSLLNYQQVIPGTSELAKGKLLIASTFGHPNYMGSYLAPVFVLAAGLVNIRSRFYTLIGAIGCITIITTLVLAGTRGSLLALIVGTAVSLALTKRSKRSLLMGTAIIAAFVVIGLIALAADDRLTASKEIAARVFYWDMGLKMYSTHPVAGIGPGRFDAMFWHQIAQAPETLPGSSWHFALTSVIRGVRPEYMHNDHLQVLVETGLFGAFLWAAVWATISCRAFSVAKLTCQNSRLSNASICGALTATAVDACFSFPFHLPCSGILFWGVLGLWVGWRTTNKITPGPVKG